jgi:hypothetical protein
MVAAALRATSRMPTGSLARTVVRSAENDWMAAPSCASGTDTPVPFRVAEAALAAVVSMDTSKIGRRFVNDRNGAARSQPASTRKAVGTARPIAVACRFRSATTWA